MNKTLDEMGFTETAMQVNTLDEAYQMLSVSGGQLLKSILIPITPALIAIMSAIVGVVDGIVGVLTIFLRVIVIGIMAAVQGVLTAIAYADSDAGLIRFPNTRRYFLQ